MNTLWAVVRRDWQAALSSRVAALFVAAYGCLTAVVTFEWGDLYARGQADLSATFALQPWLLVWLTPALALRFWSDERRQDTAEILLSLPIPLPVLVAAKWLAGVGLLALALLSTVPLWLTVAYLGQPDHGAIVAGYLGTFLLGAALLAVGSACSAATRHPVIAYITTAVVGTGLLVAGHPLFGAAMRLRVPARVLEWVADAGALPHLQALARGVVGLDDVLYFAILTVAGLSATGLLLLRLREPVLRARGVAVRPEWALLGVCLTFWIATSAASRLCGGWRIDLTEERLYTLSPATLSLLDGLDRPVTLTLYGSSRTLNSLAPYASEARRLRELLADMTARARDRLHFTVIDPQPFSEEEDRATEAGLRSIGVGEAGDTLWLGLVAESGTARATVDLFEPDQAPYLEYRIARLIREVARPSKPVVGLLSTLPMGGTESDASTLPRPAWVVDDELRRQYEVRDLLPDDATLPTGLDALVVLHPRGLSRGLVQSIGDYVGHGGRALIAVDPDAQFDGQRDDAAVGVDHASTLEPLLRNWGVRFNPNLAVGDLDNALLVGNGRGDRPVRHLGFLGLGSGNLNAEDPLTRGLHRLDFATPGYLEWEPRPNVRVQPLVQSGPASALIPVADLSYGATPESLRHGFHPTGQRYALALHLRGPLPATATAPTATAADLVVVADTDWLADMLWIRDETVGDRHVREPWANNGDFLLNVVDELTGGDALVGLRGREPRARPFTRLEAIRTRADRRLAGQAEALERSLADVSQRLSDLAGSTSGTPVHDARSRAAIVDAEQERRRLSRALRAVRHDMDREAAKLGRILYAVTVIAPLALGAALATRWRRRRTRAIVA